ncbi:hypothetical protein [Flavobacterium sp.]|uniref:hypothetical protein n=1 Tax=Flavobacterium sp. TaxID=239 RepID=UPI00286C1BDD|nr:hypothetical protein [Flavobacterium sp.]
MKILISFLNFFTVISFYSQNNKIIQLINKNDSTAIEFANIFIENKFIANSDDIGNFSIDLKQNFTSIKISHVNFGDIFFTKDVLINSDKIYIEEKTNKLEEVKIIAQKKIKKLIFPEKNILSLKTDGISFPYNLEVAIYVPNDDLLENYFIKKIIIKTAKNQFTKSNATKYVPFEVNLYSVDSIKGIPNEKIFNNNFLVSRNKSEEDVTVNLSRISKTKFTKRGIFIVIGLFDEEYYKKIGYTEKPSFKAVRRKNSSNFKEYHRWLVNGKKGDWKEARYSKIYLQCFNFGLEIIK